MSYKEPNNEQSVSIGYPKILRQSMARRARFYHMIKDFVSGIDGFTLKPSTL